MTIISVPLKGVCSAGHIMSSNRPVVAPDSIREPVAFFILYSWLREIPRPTRMARRASLSLAWRPLRVPCLSLAPGRHPEPVSRLSRHRQQGERARFQSWSDTHYVRCLRVCSDGVNAVAGIVESHGTRCRLGGKRLPDSVGVGRNYCERALAVRTEGELQLAVVSCGIAALTDSNGRQDFASYV